MLSFLKSVSEELNKGRSAVLCSILASSGSSPRGAGAKMAVFEDGTVIGTIGGGAVELICINQAKDALKNKSSFISSYVLNKNDVNNIGMICGGDVEVHFSYLDSGNKATVNFFNELYSLVAESRNVWLINIIGKKGISEYGYYTPEDGMKYISPAFRDRVMADIQFKAHLDSDAEPAIYTEPISTSSRLYIFGGGHVGKALAPVLDKIGFNVTVFDSRPELVTKENTPGAKEIIIGDYTDIFAKVTITPYDYIVIMTPGHQADFEVLNQALKTRATYIGCIGSKAKVAATAKRLREQGHTDENISRIHSPIGLPILAETPDEIAISIAAQLIKHRAMLSADE